MEPNMSQIYWDQWSHTEIMSMHGIEIDENYDVDMLHDEYRSRKFTEPKCDCAYCDNCLGISWTDFF